MAETDRIVLLFATPGHSGVDRVIAADPPTNIRVLRLTIPTKKLGRVARR